MSDSAEDMILEDIAKSMRDFTPVKGCGYCNHEIINCLNHTHCSSLGFELICDCSICGGTGKEIKENE